MTRRLLLFACCLAISACAAARQVSRGESSDLIANLRAHGFDAHDPSELDVAAAATVRAAVGSEGTLDDRLQRLALWLTDSSGIGFHYAAGNSLTAQAAFRAREGNCMAFANLFRGAARALGAETFFVQVSELPTTTTTPGVYYYSSHIAVGYRDGAAQHIVDLAQVRSDWRPALYREISPAAGTALYFSNVAIEALVSGDPARAVHMLEALLQSQGDLPELHSNLGAALARAGRFREASDLLTAAIARFPSYVPLYGNAVATSRAAGLSERADALEAKAEAVALDDPWFHHLYALRMRR